MVLKAETLNNIALEIARKVHYEMEMYAERSIPMYGFQMHDLKNALSRALIIELRLQLEQVYFDYFE